jgi:hypothetical protein
MKNATATSHGKSRSLAADGGNANEVGELTARIGFTWCDYFTIKSGNLLALANFP